MKPGELNQSISHQAIMRPKVEENVFQLLNCLDNPSRYGQFLSPYELLNEIFKLVEQASKDPCWNPYDPTCSVSVWFYGEYCYIRPFYSDRRLNFVRLFSPKRINIPTYEEFRYWDNVDTPKNISQKQWDARGKIWEEIDDNFGIVPCATTYFFEANRDWFFRRFINWAWDWKNGFKSVPKKYRQFLIDSMQKYEKWREENELDKKETIIKAIEAITRFRETFLRRDLNASIDFFKRMIQEGLIKEPSDWYNTLLFTPFEELFKDCSELSQKEFVEIVNRTKSEIANVECLREIIAKKTNNANHKQDN